MTKIQLVSLDKKKKRWLDFELKESLPVRLRGCIMKVLIMAIQPEHSNSNICPYFCLGSKRLCCRCLEVCKHIHIFFDFGTHITIIKYFSQTFRSPSKFIRGDALPQVDARYPALLFKQQLTACVEKIFGQLRDNLKKEISPLLNVCIQVHSCPSNSPQKTCSSYWILIGQLR